MAPGSDLLEALAKQLRDYTLKRHEYPFPVVQQKIDEWKRNPGIDPEEYVNIGNANGKTALHFAAQLRDDGLADLLVALRADVHRTTTRGHTALIYAAGRARDATVHRLLEAKASCRVRTANGDTAIGMGVGRLADSTMEMLRNAEMAETCVWKDFTSDAAAIAAQADHVERSPHRAQWEGDVPPAVADLLDGRRRAAEASSASEAAAIDALTRELVASWSDALTLASALLVASAGLGKRRAAPILAEAIMRSARSSSCTDECVDAVEGDDAGTPGRPVAFLERNVLTLVRAVGRSVPEAAKGDILAGLGPRQAKEARMIATSASMTALKDLMRDLDIPAARLSEAAPPWMTIELLNPAFGRLDVPRDAPAMEDTIRRLCHVGAWGSDFGTALRWLRALRAALGPGAAAPLQAAFEGLAGAFVGAMVAACAAGHELRRHMHDNGNFLAEVKDLLDDSAVTSVLEACNKKDVRVPKDLLELPVQDAASDLPFMELSVGTQVTLVADRAAWDAVEAELAMCSRIAIDTEWWDPTGGPALVQIAAQLGTAAPACFLLDTLQSPEVLAPGLLRVAKRTDLTVLGWSFAQDHKRLLELFEEHASGDGQTIKSFDVMDLQPACCRLLGCTSSVVSLSAACGRLLGRLLDKSEQCSDWRRRPLSEQQTTYAALDAIALLELHDELLRRGLDLR